MKKVFFLVNTYTIKTILLCSNLIFNEEISEMIVLEENCVEGETFEISNQIPICIVHELEECIKHSDIIIIDTSSNPKHTIKYAANKSGELSKKCYLINLYADAFTNLIVANERYKSIPTVMLISLGLYSQEVYIELSLNKIFNKANINFDIEFSEQTNEFLKLIRAANCLNSSITKNITKKTSIGAKELLIKCVNFKDINELIDRCEIVKKISPDFIIVSTDSDLISVDYLKQFFCFACLSELDLIIESHYHTAASTYTVYCNQMISSEEKLIDIESESMYFELSHKIFEKLSYPLGIIHEK